MPPKAPLPPSLRAIAESIDAIIRAQIQRSVSGDLADAPTRRAKRDRANEINGALLAAWLRTDLNPPAPTAEPSPPPSLLERLDLDEPPLDDEDTPPFIPFDTESGVTD